MNAPATVWPWKHEHYFEVFQEQYDVARWQKTAIVEFVAAESRQRRSKAVILETGKDEGNFFQLLLVSRHTR